MTAPRTVSEIAQVLRAADLLEELRGSGDAAVSGACQDSRIARPGDLFLAWKGTASDAHDFAPAAVERGAVALVVERALDLPVPQLVTTDGRRAAAIVADLLSGSPWQRMPLVGITGTNGKTTSTWIARHLLSGDRRVASLGTLGLVGDDGRVRPGTEGLTTPGPVQLSEALAGLEAEGVDAVVLEASSHALDQERLSGSRFRVGAFTNLSQDHLDYHGSMAAYGDAKRRLAELVTGDGTLVVNRDDPAWTPLVRDSRALTFSPAGEGDAALSAHAVVAAPGGSRFLLRWEGRDHPVRLPLVGAFNVENALAAVGIALALGLSIEAAIERLEQVPQIPGRLEIVAERPITVVIDFAHTPEALRNVLSALRSLTRGRLIVLFGAGGDRDSGKRMLMGAAVAEFADLAVLTSDIPRTEDPEKILDEIQPGLIGVELRREVDRTRAIRIAIDAARDGDVVVLAGKGHEAYQIIGTERRAFDEAAIVREALQARGAA